MNNVKRLFIVLLAAILCGGSFVGCASTEETAEAGNTTPTAAVEETEAETEAVDPFADFDYNGQNFRIYTSAHNASNTLVSSNFLIEGPEELTGEAAGDAALERNAAVSEMLNINMEFTQVNFGYDGVQNDVRTYIMAGADSYDLIINDLYGLTGWSWESGFSYLYGADFVFVYSK